MVSHTLVRTTGVGSLSRLMSATAREKDKNSLVDYAPLTATNMLGSNDLACLNGEISKHEPGEHGCVSADGVPRRSEEAHTAHHIEVDLNPSESVNGLFVDLSSRSHCVPSREIRQSYTWRDR